MEITRVVGNIYADEKGRYVCPHETPKQGEIAVLTCHDPRDLA